MREKVRRAWDRAMSRGRLVRPYRPESWSVARWNESYASGQLTYFADLDELARYSILIGYLRFFNGRPSILDVGCGPGLMRQRLDDKRFRQYVGIDLSAEAIRRAGSMADERTTFVCGDFTDFDGPTVDVVVLNEVLYFAASPARMLDHVGACLRAGGLLLTSIWRHPGDLSLWRLLDQRFEALDAVRVCNESSRLAPDGWRISCHRNPTVETAATLGMGL